MMMAQQVGDWEEIKLYHLALSPSVCRVLHVAHLLFAVENHLPGARIIQKQEQARIIPATSSLWLPLQSKVVKCQLEQKLA